MALVRDCSTFCLLYYYIYGHQPSHSMRSAGEEDDWLLVCIVQSLAVAGVID